MSLIALAAPVWRVCDFCLIFVPFVPFVPFGHYDEPEILSYAIPLFCSIGADVRQSNRIFSSYDVIVTICCEARNKLIDQPWKIMSIGLREWALRF
jgi:hypothetical protein